MSTPELRGYFLTVAFGRPVAARVSLNTIPVYFVSPKLKPGTSVEPVNHFLVPGRNSCTIEVATLAPAEHMSADLRVDHKPDQELCTFMTVRPCDRNADPPPYGVSHLFDVEDAPEPPYESAPPATFGAGGTSGQWQVVRRLHGALERADSDAFLEELAAKFANLRCVYGPQRKLGDDYLREDYGRAMRSGCVPQPLADDIVFESCLGGRVALVRRADGSWPLKATMGRAIPFRTHVYLLHEGADRWSVLW